jgi:hypothetical protein
MVIYQIENLINGKKYIGRDSLNRPGYLGGGTAIKSAVKKYGRNNFNKTVIEICKDYNHLLEREEYWLNFYDVVNNPNFYNMISSNNGWEKGKPRLEQLGRVNSQETRNKISKAGKGKTGKTSGKPKPVIQYEVTILKKFITEYPSSIKAEEVLGISSHDIRAAARGKQNTAGGFIWEYKILNKNISRKSRESTPIYQYSYEKVLIPIREYDSINHASKTTNIKQCDISAVCNGKQNTAGGYIWEHKNNK